MKLTPTQHALLMRAAQRNDRAVELPPNLKGGPAQKAIAEAEPRPETQIEVGHAARCE